MKARANFIPVLFVAFSLAACSPVEPFNIAKLSEPIKCAKPVELVKRAKPKVKEVIMKWLGTVGWEIRTGTTIILIDPFLTRERRIKYAEWKTNEEAVLKVITGADYIFGGHSHADHIGDVPFIAKRFCSRIIGSRTTTNLAITDGVDKSQVIPIRGGEKLDFKDFSVQVIESEHGIGPGRTRPPRFREIEKPFAGPIMGSDFVVGGSFLYYFTFGTHRVLHQSTGNFIEKELTGVHPDIVLLNWNHRAYNLERFIKKLKPKVVIIHHYDQWDTPFSEGIPDRRRRKVQKVAREVTTVDSQIKVIIPDFFMTYTLETSPKSY